MPAITVIKFRKGTAAAWTSANSVLAAGEPGLETDTNKFKFGDGTTAWNSLDYAGGGTASVVVSDTAPADPTADMVWFNSAEASAYIYYDSTWVPLSPGIAGPIGPRGYSGLISQATAPGDTSVLWMDTADASSQVAVPAGGTAGQILAKTTGTDYATGWVDRTGNTNAIINGAFDIWQRGTTLTSSSNGLAPADRWYMNVSGSFTASQQTTGVPSGSRYCMRVLANGIQAVNSIQFLETNESLKFAGKNVVAQVKIRRNATLTQSIDFAIQKSATVDAGIGATWITISTTTIANASMPTGTTSADWFTATVSASIPNDGTANSLRIIIASGTIPSGGYYELAEAQLEAGSVATPFRRNASSLQGELAACQRYYWRHAPGIQYKMMSDMGIGTSSTGFAVPMRMPVTMRSAPTSVEFSNLYIWQRDYSVGDVDATVTGVALGYSSSDFPEITVTTASGLTNKATGFIRAATSTGYIAFSAEL